MYNFNIDTVSKLFETIRKNVIDTIQELCKGFNIKYSYKNTSINDSDKTKYKNILIIFLFTLVCFFYKKNIFVLLLYIIRDGYHK